ncbi:MAG: hypothetical protein GY927_19990, partial [bacterium]|nr:hypothetical protein [bacterium]
MTDYSAAASGLGYLHQQVIYSLYLILERHEPHFSIRLEGLDDIEIHGRNALYELMQVKHHLKPDSSLSNRNVDLWKTIGIWSDHAKKDWLSLPGTRLTLLTTSKISDGSIAALLRPEHGRNSTKACQLLREEATSCRLTTQALQKLSKTALSSTILKLLEKLKNVRYPSVQVFWDTLKQESANKINLDPHKGLILSNMQPTRELAKAFALFMSLP